MTVFEAYSKLWIYFKKKDTFTMEDNFIDIIKISDEPSRDRACVQSALDDWVKSEMLMVQKDFSWEKDDKEEPKDIYILKKSLDSNEQSVSVHPNLAGIMMGEINEFCNLIEDKTDWCNAMDISSKDVMNLLHILSFYKSKYKEAVGEDSDGEK